MNPDSCDILREKAEESGPLRVLFVCLGNICRSPAAEGILRQKAKEAGINDRLYIDSAGTYGGHRGELPDKRMRVHAIRRGYDLTHLSRPARESDFHDFDVIIAMDDSNLDRLKGMAPTPEDEKKVMRMTDFCPSFTHIDHVPDPYYDGAEGFENVLDILEDGCAHIIRLLDE